jgi:pimeloyl-ACP methyl ester carboxylesterase
MLEVIDKGTCTEAHPVPLLFVHGGWHSASCWDNFVDFFSHAGYRALAMSLRGHGGSPTAKPFHACSIADYVDDVAATADSLGGHPVDLHAVAAGRQLSRVHRYDAAGA